MFLLFNNVEYIHFYNQKIHIYTSDKKKIVLNEVESYILRELINKNFQIEDTENAFVSKYEISKEKAHQLIEKFVDKYSDCFWVNQNQQNKDLVIKGEWGRSYPNNVILYLTNRCYHKCKHCFKGIPQEYVDLDFQELTSFLDFIKGKTAKIQLTGGEPFLYPKIKEIIDRYSGAFRISITSSGYDIPDNVIDTIKKVCLIQISVYSCNPQMNDDFMQRPGAFNKIIDNIQRLINNGNYVKISNVITPENMDNIEHFINFCINLGVKEITFGKVVPIGNAENNKSLILSHDEIIRVRHKLSTLKEKYSQHIKFDDWGENDWSEKIIEDNTTKFFSCDAGSLSWTVLECGDIQPCSLINCTELSMGNLKAKSYQDLIFNNGISTVESLWNIKIPIKYRKQLHQICQSITYKGEYL